MHVGSEPGLSQVYAVAINCLQANLSWTSLHQFSSLLTAGKSLCMTVCHEDSNTIPASCTCHYC